MYFTLYLIARTYYHADQPEPNPDSEEVIDANTVACPDCGNRNNRGYRFCRQCVSELPGATSVEIGPRFPFGRRVS